MKLLVIFALLCSQYCIFSLGFVVHPHHSVFPSTRLLVADPQRQLSLISSVKEATQILREWDRHNNPDVDDAGQDFDAETVRSQLPEAIRLLNAKASEERQKDSTQGRCMLGICAPSTEEAVGTLKAWVTNLELPRGLLHGMDKDGMPIEIEGSVYIKYNTGGSATFADIRRSGIGFDALWKPGDALIEPYDGTYRGVYFQVELSDGEFRQYLVPLDTFVL